MHSTKYYSSDPRGSRAREYGDSTSGRYSGHGHTAYTTNMFVEPKEGKVDKENYLTKEDSRSVSENVTKSVTTRSVIDKRSSSSYKTREDIKAVKTRDLKGITSAYTDTSKFDSSRPLGMDENVKDSPISSFYSTYSRDEDLSDAAKFDKPAVNGEDVISSFYRSGTDRRMSDQRTRRDERDGDSRHDSRYMASSSGQYETRGERRTAADNSDPPDSIARRSSIERCDKEEETASDSVTQDSKTIGLEDINILRRALERKQASNSLERGRLTQRHSEDGSSDPSQHTSSAYVSLSNKWKDKDSGSSRFLADTSYDQYNDVAGRWRNEEPVGPRRSVDSVKFSENISTRSLSSEALDDKKRSSRGIYQELPGRKEFISYTARARSDEDKELLQESRRTSGSLERDARRIDYTGQRERERRDSLLRSKSKSSEELRKDKDSGSSRFLADTTYDQYNDVADRWRNEEPVRPRRSVDSVNFSENIRTRSLSSEALDDKRRSSRGIYQELPGRKEFISYTARARSDEDKELLQESRRTGSLERDARKIDYTGQRERERRDSLLGSKSKSSEELRTFNKEDENETYPSYRSRYLHPHGSTERERALGRDRASRGDIGIPDVGSYSPRKESSTHEKLREYIARLKTETEVRAIKKDDMGSPYPFSSEPSIQDKLKEDIAKLKAETLTREHAKPYIPPSSSRVESKDVSSGWRRREPSIQDKLKEDIAKLKAETRAFPSPSRKASDITTHRMRPANKEKEDRDVRQSGLATSSFNRYEYSKRDGDVFKDEIRSKESHRYGDPKDHRYGYTTYKDGELRKDEDTVTRDERTYTDSKFRDDVFPGPSEEYYRPTSDYEDPFLQRPNEKDQPRFFASKPDDGWPRKDERRLIERGDSLISSRNMWDEPTQTRRETRSGSTQGYATKRVFKADSTVAMTSTKNGDHGPSSVRGFFHGSVSEEDQSAYYSKGMGDKETSYTREPYRRPETSRPPESYRPPEDHRPPESYRPSEDSRQPESYRPSESYRPPEDFRLPESYRPSEDSRQPESYRPTEDSRPSESYRPPEDFRPPESYRPPEDSRLTESFGPSALSRPSKPTRPKESSRQSETPEPEPEPYRPPESPMRPHEAIPLPYPGLDSITRKREDSIVSIGESRNETNQKEIEKKEREVRSNREQTSREFVTRKTIREDSVISRKSSIDDVDRPFSRVDTSRRLSERSDLSPRRVSIHDEILTSEESKISSPKEFVETIREYEESKPSAMSILRKKIEQLKSKVDALDDSRSRSRLERYVDEHSEKTPDVEIKDPVHIPRYQPSARMPERDYVVDVAEPHVTRPSTDLTSETISRQISRQTSVANTMHRISSIREEDMTDAPRTIATDETPYEVLPEVETKPEEKPAVMVQTNLVPRSSQTRDAETMTAPEIQEHMGIERFQRLNSTISEFVEEPEQIAELRGVPFDHRGSEPHIQEVVDTGDMTDSGMTIIQIDSLQQPLSPKKDKQRWWNAFTAEDVDRLLELGSWSQWNGYTNAYTAEDVDKLLHLGPVRRRSFRRGSYERRSFRRHPRRAKDDVVDVHVRVRGRQETRSRPQCIIAKAAPEEKAIVLRDAKKSADPYIRKIKVDDVYGADAVRVENGVVKIKVGDLTTRGRKAWARILQQKDRIIESDGTVTIPVSRDQYQDGVYYTNYYEGQDQDGTVRIPITFKLQEDNKLKTKKLRVAREIKRAGSVRRRRRAAGSKAYIAGARYYHDNVLMSADGYGSQDQQQRTAWRTRRDSSKVAGNEIVLRRSQPYTVPMQTIQRIHEGHKTTRQATSYRNDGGKMVITVHAVPARPAKFNLQQVGENMSQTSGILTSDSCHNNISGRRGVSSTSRNYYITSGSGGERTSQGYTMHPISGRQSTSYIVTDPSDSYRRRSSGFNGVTRVRTLNEVPSTPTIVPYVDDVQSGRRAWKSSDSFIADPSSFYDSHGSRTAISGARVNARTAYGEKFNLKDYGDISKVQYVNGALKGSGIINNRWSNGRYRYGSSWNSKQQERLNGRTMSWAVEEVAPDF